MPTGHCPGDELARRGRKIDKHQRDSSTGAGAARADRRCAAVAEVYGRIRDSQGIVILA